MEATARFRLLHNRGAAAVEERRVGYRRAATARGVRRRGSRRRRSHPGICSAAAPGRQYILLLLILAVGTGTIVRLRLFALASWSSRNSKNGKHERPPGLGPDAIPSTLLYQRRLPSLPGDIRKGLVDNTLDTGIKGGGGTVDRKRGCSNTVQGISLLTDSEGRVCRRRDQDPQRPGCCAASPHQNGRYLLVKEDGGLEELRSDLDLVGAGASLGPTTEDFPPIEAFFMPFSCWSCDVGKEGSSCCRSYEFCVSCCQDPGRAEELEAIRVAMARAGHPAYVDFDEGNIAGHQQPQPPPHPPVKSQRAALLRAFDLCAFRCRTYSGSVAHENTYRGPLKHCFGKFRPPMSQIRGTTYLQLDPFLSEIKRD